MTSTLRAMESAPIVEDNAHRNELYALKGGPDDGDLCFDRVRHDTYKYDATSDAWFPQSKSFAGRWPLGNHSELGTSGIEYVVTVSPGGLCKIIAYIDPDIRNWPRSANEKIMILPGLAPIMRGSRLLTEALSYIGYGTNSKPAGESYGVLKLYKIWQQPDAEIRTLTALSTHQNDGFSFEFTWQSVWKPTAGVPIPPELNDEGVPMLDDISGVVFPKGRMTEIPTTLADLKADSEVGDGVTLSAPAPLNPLDNAWEQFQKHHHLYVTTGDGTRAFYDGSAWQQGVAP